MIFIHNPYDGCNYVKSVHPELWKEYSAIVGQYQNAGWGIYDDTVDLNRAIVMSDAYDGERSSVVTLCRKAEIPVLLQEVNV